MKSVDCVTFDTCWTQLFLVHTCQCFFLPRGAVKLTPFPLWTVQLRATATVQDRQCEKGWSGAAIISDYLQVQKSNRKKCGAVFLYLCSSSPFQRCFSRCCITSSVCGFRSAPTFCAVCQEEREKGAASGWSSSRLPHCCFWMSQPQAWTPTRPTASLVYCTSTTQFFDGLLDNT